MTLRNKYEKQLIGRLVSDHQTYFENSDIITADLFKDYRHVFDVFKQMATEGRHPTLVKMIDLFPDISTSITEMFTEADYSIPIHELTEELKEFSRIEILNRKIAEAVHARTSQEKTSILAEAVTELSKSEGAKFETGFEAAVDMLNNLETKQLTGVPTGFAYLDGAMGGFQPTDLVIVAAESSQGKTSLALNMTQTAIDHDHGVAFISLEMSNRQLIKRMICAKTAVPFKKLKENIALIQQAGSEYKNQPLYIADITNNSIDHISGLIRNAYIRYGIKIAVIDYLQLLGDRTQRSREQEVGKVTRALKNLAKELKITVIALSQLSRPKVAGQYYPTMSRLRDSGQIEEAADVIVFIYRPEVYGIEEYEGENTMGLAEIIMAKGRNYGTGRFKCRFEESTTRFIDGFAHGNFGGTCGVSEIESPF